jgi:Fe-S-cluster-containing dehydrogenase component
MKRYALVIDDEACWGCKTCEVACKQELQIPAGVRLIAVKEDGPKMVEDKPHFLYRVNLCKHCEEPPCADACPEEAITRRADGIVLLDCELCNGCQACVEACPYGSITFDAQQNIARKCNLCHHRVEKGLLPACADNVCPAHCIHLKKSP